MIQASLDIPQDRIADFRRRWQVTEFSLFGSVLRDDFRPDSDVDVLVVFAPGVRLGWEDWEAMERRNDQLALAKAVELIGEAASRVSQAYRDAHPEIPWSAIIGMRHRLVHDYRRIDL